MQTFGGERTVAVVVTYLPDDAVTANLEALRSQVQALVVVDNGSAPQQVALLQLLAARLAFDLIQNGRNLGIATALNQGVRAALAAQADWVLLFDQDSRVTPGFVPHMIAAFEQAELTGPVGQLVPTYRDLRHGTAIPANRLPDGSLEVAMTSGSLFRAQIFPQLGFFADELFIDAVDHEYALRLRRAGFRILDCNAVLLHSPGTPTRHTLLGKPFESANYSPTRRFYQERNRIWMIRRYARTFPRYCARLLVLGAKEFTKILLVEPVQRRSKLRAFFRGFWHGLTNRMGPME